MSYKDSLQASIARAEAAEYRAKVAEQRIAQLEKLSSQTPAPKQPERPVAVEFAQDPSKPDKKYYHSDWVKENEFTKGESITYIFTGIVFVLSILIISLWFIFFMYR